MQRYEVIIIGGGPAGLTSGLYASRFGLKTLLIERGIFGGQSTMATLLENYPGFPEGISGFDLAEKMHQQAVNFGLQTVSDDVAEVKTNPDSSYSVNCADSTYTTNTIIIAAGAEYAKLGVAGEGEFIGKGVSYCATCDGFLFHGKEVAVIGGGDTAITDALELSQHASMVSVIHRRDQLRASHALQQKAFSNDKLKFIWNSIVEKIAGNDMVTGVGVKNVKTGEASMLKVDGVFIAVGVKPNSKIFSNVVDIDENGNIIVLDNALRTKTTGIFAAGDIRTGSVRQVSTAVGDGATAAMAAFKYLKS